MAEVIRLPDHGQLLVCTDLQGCLRDFRAIVDKFERVREDTYDDAHLLFTGDLIHGPQLDEQNWPDFLGEYYRDRSAEIIEEFVTLRERYPGYVHALLGNKEHGHIGGPHTAKFADDEVFLFEQRLGPERTAHLIEVFNTFALAAIAPCGEIFTHGAPAADINSVEDVQAVDVHTFHCPSSLNISHVPILGPILWARSASQDTARTFCKAMGGAFCIHGHDVVPSGFERIGDEQMVISTSFGVLDEHKVYVQLDLSATYNSVQNLNVGREILPLYADKAIKRLSQ